MELALAEGDVPAMRALSRATCQMTEGEILGLGVQRGSQLTRDQYLEITRRKTASFSPSRARSRRTSPPRSSRTASARGVRAQHRDVLPDRGRYPRHHGLAERTWASRSSRTSGRASSPCRSSSSCPTSLPPSGPPSSASSRPASCAAPPRAAARAARAPRCRRGVQARGGRVRQPGVAALVGLPQGPEVNALAAAPRFVVERDY